MNGLPTLKILDKIYDLLLKMDKRLKVVEDSVKREQIYKEKEKDKKQLLND
jgi:hypothetical protein